jgi:hypothetical protein
VETLRSNMEGDRLLESRPHTNAALDGRHFDMFLHGSPLRLLKNAGASSIDMPSRRGPRTPRSNASPKWRRLTAGRVVI